MTEDLDAVGGRVNHPIYYQVHGVECIEAIRGAGYDLGAAIKYVYRAWDKGDVLRDLKAAHWYLLDHMHHADAQHHHITARSGDALRRIAQHAPPNSLPRRYFFALADGLYGRALEALDAMIDEAQ